MSEDSIKNIKRAELLKISKQQDDQQQQPSNKKKKKKEDEKQQKQDFAFMKMDSYKHDIEISNKILGKNLNSHVYLSDQVVEKIKSDLKNKTNEEKLLILKEKYDKYGEYTDKESESLANDDWDSLEIYMKKKARILLKTKLIQNSLELHNLKKKDKKNKENSKENEILSDIHTRMNKIMNEEEENRKIIEIKKSKLLKKMNVKNIKHRRKEKYQSGNNEIRFLDTKK